MANWYDDQLTNRNFLSPIGFLFTLEKAKKVSFLCQRAEIPTISLGNVDIPTRGMVPIPVEGNISYGDFSVEFIVDEDLKNYYSIHQWMRDNGNADQMARTTGEDDIYTHAQLHIVTSSYNPAFVVEFRDMFPVSLSNLQFDATITDVEYITAEVTFKHQQFFIRDKNMNPL